VQIQVIRAIAQLGQLRVGSAADSALYVEQQAGGAGRRAAKWLL